MFTYFLDGKDCIKIGRSKKPHKRVYSIQSSCPYELELIDLWFGDDEKHIHEFWAEYRINGEWFEKRERLGDYIKAIREFIDWRGGRQLILYGEFDEIWRACEFYLWNDIQGDFGKIQGQAEQWRSKLESGHYDKFKLIEAWEHCEKLSYDLAQLIGDFGNYERVNLDKE